MNELSDIKTYAHKNAVPIMQDEGSDFICSYIREHNLKSILEIGTAIGYSSIKFAKIAPDVQVTTIEIDIDRHIQAKQNFSDEGLSNQITAILGDAAQQDITDKFNLVFIDGPKAQYIKLFNKFKNNLTENGVIISDNLSFHGMVEDMSLTHNDSTKKLVRKIRNYIDFLEENQEFTTEFLNYGDKISISRKKI